jgi:hypothetical protein
MRGVLVYTVARAEPHHRFMFGPLWYLRSCHRYTLTSHVLFRCAVPHGLA